MILRMNDGTEIAAEGVAKMTDAIWVHVHDTLARAVAVFDDPGKTASFTADDTVSEPETFDGFTRIFCIMTGPGDLVKIGLEKGAPAE